MFDVIDLTAVWNTILNFFYSIYDWLATHNIRIGTFEVSLFTLSLSAMCLSVLFWAFVPWFNDDDEEEN